MVTRKKDTTSRILLIRDLAAQGLLIDELFDFTFGRLDLRNHFLLGASTILRDRF